MVKTHAGQYELFVAHLERHQQLRTGAGRPQTYVRLWTTLTAELNAYGAGPKRTSQQWQAHFSHWKLQVLHEARLRTSLRVGTIKLSNVKERALNAWGRVLVDGNNIGVVGRGVPAISFDAQTVYEDVGEEAKEARKTAKRRQLEALTASDDKIADAISCLADKVGKLVENIANNTTRRTEYYDRMLANQARMLAYQKRMLEKYMK